jgi:hypothetical protein
VPVHGFLLHETMMFIHVSWLDYYLMFAMHNSKLPNWNLQDLSPRGAKDALLQLSVL